MNDSTSPETIDLRSYVQPVWRRKWLVLAVTLLAAVGAYLIASSERKTYVASTQVYIEQASPTAGIGTGQTAGAPTAQQLQDIATLFTAQSVTTRVYRALGLPVGAAGSVSVSPHKESSFIDLTAESHTPEMAARLANAYVAAFLGARRSQIIGQARAERRAAQASLATLPRNPNDANAAAQRQTLLAQISQLQSIELNPTVGARQIDTASVPGSPSSPKPKEDAIFGVAIGLVLAILIAFGLEALDNRLLSISAIEAIFKRPVLTVLPHADEAAPAIDGRPAVTPEFVEAMRTLRVNLRLANPERPPRTILVTSSLPGEGKSTVARSLALAYVEAGERVLVIDADLRRPAMTSAFGVQAQTGVAQVLHSKVSLADAAVAVTLAAPSEARMNGAGRNGDSVDASMGTVQVLAHGEQVRDPVTLLSSQPMRALVSAAAEAYDVVVIDTPPLLPVSDTVPLLELVDAAVVVVRLGQSTRGTADRGAEIVQRIPGIELAGVVVNDMPKGFAGGYGGYGYQGYGYGYSTDKSKAGV